MIYTKEIRNLYVFLTIMTIGILCIIKHGVINMHSVFTTGLILIPAVVVMAFIGERIGNILDHPKNKTDADYKIAVLNALKKLDKNMTLQDLNEKLSKPEDEVEEEQENETPEEETNDEDLDI